MQEHCEEYGRMLNADPSVVSTRAKKRGLPQLGTLGAGNHYAEIQVRLTLQDSRAKFILMIGLSALQVVDEIYDKFAAGQMGIDRKGQVVVMIHCGSRGFGHQVDVGGHLASRSQAVTQCLFFCRWLQTPWWLWRRR